MDKLRPHNVGRLWYVAIKQHELYSEAMLGTHHPATGTQVWTRTELGVWMDQMTERQVLDELWQACTDLMEARSHLL